MEPKDILLNYKWKNYFNISLLLPIYLCVGVVLLVGIMYLIFSHDPANGSLESVVGFLGVSLMLLFVGSIAVVISYLVWFIMATDTLFQYLGINRMIGNILNLVGIFVFPCLSFIILPLYFWLKMKDYWLVKGQRSSWKAVAY